MSALSIRHMNFTVQEMEHVRADADRAAYMREDIFEQMTVSAQTANILKRNELSWARTKEGLACKFCQMAFRFHRQEKDTLEQMTVLASIMGGDHQTLEPRRDLIGSPAFPS